MKEPLDKVLQGDKVRVERNMSAMKYDAIEYTARHDHDTRIIGGTYYLIEPRKPAVELPEFPTLGWATGTPLGGGLGSNMLIQTMGKGRGGTALRSELYFDSSKVTAFTPATPIPTEALDELFRIHSHFEAGAEGIDHIEVAHAVTDFLAAVDGAA